MDFVDSYILLMKNEHCEGTLTVRRPDMYSYIIFLTDVYNMLQLQSDFIKIRARNGFTVESDSDLMLIFELYKETLEITFTITTKVIALNIEMTADKRNGKNIYIERMDHFSSIDEPLLGSERHYVRKGRGRTILLRGGC